MTTFMMVLTLFAPATAQQAPPAACPMHTAHATSARAAAPQQSHAAHADMDARGTVAMGFDQSRATHHFTVLATGGVIEITANAKEDEAVRSQIVAHLGDISRRFKAGDFGIPEATHGVVPPGAAGMAASRDHIEYRFEPIPDGGRVHITTSDRAALAAVHAFLRYQIDEHRTGGSPAPRA
ncbi:MAG: hypothetical protein M3Q55_02250 [Acidobacteriota bacterium]|nr:hypothetical protein [Acidobacteriota bacterium]